MPNSRSSRITLIACLLSGVAFVAWTAALPLLAGVDAWWRPTPPPAQHWLGQIGSALAVVTVPVVVLVVLLGLATWASRRQLTSLAGALVLASVLAAGGGVLVAELVARERPSSPWSFLFTHQGWSYPSVHVVTVTTATVMVVLLVSVARRGASAVLAARIAGPLLVLAVGLERVMMGASRVTDVIGGVLLGIFVATLAGAVCGVHVPRRGPARTDGEGGRRAAIIHNPTKVVDHTIFSDLIQRRLAESGWDPPIWLPTTAVDPGHGMAMAALESEVDLVMVAGGDGTVRVVSGALAGTGTAMAIIPSGTGNLLARNVGIPLDMDRAVDVALEGRTGEIDVLKVQVPGKADDHAVVMCGVGADASIIADTNEDLKRQIGVGAYVVAGLGHVRTRPVHTRVTIDDEEPFERDSSLTMVANVGDLQAGLTIAPEATASDGELHVIVASPADPAELAQLISAVLTKGAAPESLVRRPGRRVHVELAEEHPYQLDGDIAGNTTEMAFEIMPGALKLQLPR